MYNLFVFTTPSKREKEQHKELLDDVMYNLSYLTCSWSPSIIQSWKEAQDEPISAPVYNNAKGEMELKVWCRGYFPFKQYIKESLD